VSKCFYEGGFTVYCNKTKLPSSTQTSDSTPLEVMRYARLTNGLQYNDSLCSYLPNTSCHKKQSLVSCVDKPYCSVENTWASLEPNCRGNSFYSQLDYDCQPAYSMCDSTVESINAFSGIIYSPNYPSTFRSDRIEPCYLTVNLPKNHHVEITLDYFDLLKTPNCIGDYVEIQQYIKVNNNNNADYTSKFLSNKRMKSNSSTSNASNVIISGESFNNNNKNATRPAIRLHKQLLSRNSHLENPVSKMFRPNQGQQQQQQPGQGKSKQPKRAEYKWHTLVTVCGKIEKGYTIRATENTINFKFRPLPASHNYLANVNRQFQGFKIYFQAVPPKPIVDESPYDDDKPARPTSAGNKNSTSVLTTKVFDLDPYADSSGSSGNDVNYDNTKPNKTILKSEKRTQFLMSI
jgi:hypothetical protein